MRPAFEIQATSELDVARAERDLGRRFPQSYRAFLLEGNGGTPTPETWGQGADEIDVHDFYRADSVARLTDREHRMIHRLFIADTSTGDQLALDLATGAIFLRNHEHPADDVAGAYRQIAPDFDSLWSGFHEAEG